MRGLYTAAAGMTADTVRMDILANNLANAATPGYKRDTPLLQSFDGYLVHRLEAAWPGRPGESLRSVPVGMLGHGVYVAGNAARLGSAGLQATGNPLDVAIVGDGFFRLLTPEGERYTRQGRFMQDSEGRLVSVSGDLVLAGGAPVGQPGQDMRIDEAGDVYVGGIWAGRLDIVSSAEAGPLRKEGENRWAPAAPGLPGSLLAMPAAEAAEPYTLRVGFLETSDVEPVREIVDLIRVMRSYEANQRVVRAHDETLGRLVNASRA